LNSAIQSIYEQRAIALLHEFMKPVRELIDDDSVTEIMVNNLNNIWFERAGVMQKFEGRFLSQELNAALKNIAGLNEKEMSVAFDGQLDGIRIAAALKPVSINGNSICIRKHTSSAITMGDYCDRGLFDLKPKTEAHLLSETPPYELAAKGGSGLAEFFEWMVVSKKSLLVAGATGSGKTTLMRALMRLIPKDERLVTIEDTSELKINDHPNFVSFEANKEKGVYLKDLVKLSLRYRPDRIVMGEVRAEEAYDLMDAFGTGHEGGCCSMHGESALLALNRLENMLRRSPFTANTPLPALRADICKAFKFVVFTSGRSGQRCPEELIELTGVNERGEYEYNTVFRKFV